MLNRERVLEAFRHALDLCVDLPRTKLRPRTVAVRAHAVYCQKLRDGEKVPALVTFRKFVQGKRALPVILNLLSAASVISGVEMGNPN